VTERQVVYTVWILQTKVMIHIPDGMEQMVRDFIMLFRMVCNFKLRN
jgi:hypothetical protein